MNLLSVVVPVYREEKNIRPFLSRITKTIEQIQTRYEIIFVLDPSPDNTEDIILKEMELNNSIKLLVLSRRFGQPAATMAGIYFCTGDYCVVIDVDLQDPPELINDMLKKMNDGYEVIYAKRRSRKGENFIKRGISFLGYFIISQLSDLPIPRDTGDFRVMTRRVIEEIKRLNENHGFLRGLVAYIGFKQGYVEYDRDSRLNGIGKNNQFFGSFRIGLNGLIGFSSRPLQIMSLGGMCLAFFAFMVGTIYVLQKMMGVNLTPGLSTTVLVVTFFSGIQLMGMGLIGEYIGRIYDEVKRRPQYIIDRKINI